MSRGFTPFRSQETANPFDSKQLVGRSQTLIVSNGTRANQPKPHCRQRHEANKPSQRPLIDTTSISCPKNRLLIATNGTPIKSFGIRQIELQMGPSNCLLFATIGTPIKSFGTRQIELQLGLQNSQTGSSLQTQPPHHDPVPLTIFK